MKESQNDLQKLGKLSIHDFKKTKGIGDAKAIALSAAFELGKRRGALSWNNKVKITSSKTAFGVLCVDLQELSHEEFFVLYLNRGNYLIQKKRISIGGVSETIADGKIIFKVALELNASGIILAHNHPSGQLFPSDADKQLTRRLKEFGKLIDIAILDHLIISEQGYYSFSDEGMN